MGDWNARAKRWGIEMGKPSRPGRRRRPHQTEKSNGLTTRSRRIDRKIVYRVKLPIVYEARGTQDGRKIGTKRNRNRDLDVVFGCRFAACCTLRFSTRNACWQRGLRGKGCRLTGWSERGGSLGQVHRIELEDHTLTTSVSLRKDEENGTLTAQTQKRGPWHG